MGGMSQKPKVAQEGGAIEDYLDSLDDQKANEILLAENGRMNERTVRRGDPGYLGSVAAGDSMSLDTATWEALHAQQELGNIAPGDGSLSTNNIPQVFDDAANQQVAPVEYDYDQFSDDISNLMGIVTDTGEFINGMFNEAVAYNGRIGDEFRTTIYGDNGYASIGGFYNLIADQWSDTVSGVVNLASGASSLINVPGLFTGSTQQAWSNVWNGGAKAVNYVGSSVDLINQGNPRAAGAMYGSVFAEGFNMIATGGIQRGLSKTGSVGNSYLNSQGLGLQFPVTSGQGVFGSTLGNIKFKNPAIRNIDSFNFGSHLTKMIGSAPKGMVDPHAHHILFKKGNGVAQQALVKEGQKILKDFDIDPIYGVENLAWAPNRVAGQHGIDALQNVVERLKLVRDFGGNRVDIVKELELLAEVARQRK